MAWIRVDCFSNTLGFVETTLLHEEYGVVIVHITMSLEFATIVLLWLLYHLAHPIEFDFEVGEVYQDCKGPFACSEFTAIAFLYIVSASSKR